MKYLTCMNISLIIFNWGNQNIVCQILLLQHSFLFWCIVCSWWREKLTLARRTTMQASCNFY